MAGQRIRRLGRLARQRRQDSIRKGASRRMTQLVRCCLAALIGLLLGLATPSTALAAPTLAASSYTYDSGRLADASTGTAPERGPPFGTYNLDLAGAVESELHGSSARPSFSPDKISMYLNL
jgi:hypothetical protein